MSRSRVRTGALALVLAAGLTGGAVAPAAAAPTPSAGTLAGMSTSLAGVDMERVTIPQLQAAMDAGRLTSVRLTQYYLDRVARIDPLVNAILALNGEALAQAAASDRARAAGGARGALEGIPVLLKDNVDTADQGATAGSEALVGSRPDDAALVTNLRASGAVIIGKANLSEWANFRSTGSSSGWSAVGGQTNNPYVLDRNPCGSSSGSGAGVASSLAVVAVGTETDGSIVCPAAANGVVGFKPTLGVISGDGVVPISSEQDTAGPMARSVTDAAVALGVLDTTQTDWTTALDANALRGKRIGVWSTVTGDTSPDVDALFEQTKQTLRDLGATPVEVDLPYQDKVGANEFPALLVEFAHDVNAYLADTPGAHPADLAGLIDFNEARAATELIYFDQDIFLAAQSTGGDLTEPRYQRARAVATGAAQRSIDETLARYDLDAIAAPTNSPAWRTTLGEGDAFLFGSSSPAAAGGYPNVSVPMGYVGLLPVGLSIFASAGDDAAVLGLAYAFEQATQVRRPPTFRASIG